MVNWESQSKRPPQSPEDGHIYCILLIRIAFFHVSQTCHFTACCISLWTSIHVSMLTQHVTSSRFCLYSLNIYHFTYTFSHARTEAHTHKHTCMSLGSAYKSNGDNQAQEPGWEGRNKYNSAHRYLKSKTKIRTNRACLLATRLFLKK